MKKFFQKLIQPFCSHDYWPAQLINRYDWEYPCQNVLSVCKVCASQKIESFPPETFTCKPLEEIIPVVK